MKKEACDICGYSTEEMYFLEREGVVCSDCYKYHSLRETLEQEIREELEADDIDPDTQDYDEELEERLSRAMGWEV
jgi:hypothetical protein